MGNDDKFWLSLWLGLFLILWTGVSVVCLINWKWDLDYIKNGYTRKYFPGAGMYWVAPDGSRADR